MGEETQAGKYDFTTLMSGKRDMARHGVTHMINVARARLNVNEDVAAAIRILNIRSVFSWSLMAATVRLQTTTPIS